MGNKRLQTSTAWQNLKHHHKEIADRHMRDWFADDAGRAAAFSLELDDFLVDFSKHRITERTLELLVALADAAAVRDRTRALFAGERINVSEDRAAMHPALRAPEHTHYRCNGEDLSDLVTRELARCRQFVEQVHNGTITGSTGKPLARIINIGIGGSDLGPRLVTEALQAYRHTGGPDVAFVANLDAQELYGVLDDTDPETVLFIVTSKSFTTLETHANALTAKHWLLDNGCREIDRHFAAVSSNLAATSAFGIADDRVFQIWDWVGGRYSVWSAVGLPVAMYLGMENFYALLRGAYVMDQHFLNTPLRGNIPVLLGMLDIWYNNFFGAETLTVVPYDQRLRLLPEFLSQLVMESNGKGVTVDNEMLGCHSSHIVWGSIGTNAQHAYFQMLHQGTRLVPVEFLLPLSISRNDENHHKMVANCLAQSKALMLGQENLQQPYRNFPGNRPSTTIVYQGLTPVNLGMLLAMYEHRTFVQAMVWDINPFDQWGVELGKVLAGEIITEFAAGEIDESRHDSSTLQLMKHYLDRKWEMGNGK